MLFHSCIYCYIKENRNLYIRVCPLDFVTVNLYFYVLQFGAQLKICWRLVLLPDLDAASLIRSSYSTSRSCSFLSSSASRWSLNSPSWTRLLRSLILATMRKACYCISTSLRPSIISFCCLCFFMKVSGRLTGSFYFEITLFVKSGTSFTSCSAVDLTMSTRLPCLCGADSFLSNAAQVVWLFSIARRRGVFPS